MTTHPPMYDDDEPKEDGSERSPTGDVFDDDDPDAPNLVPETGPPPRVLPGGIELRGLLGEGGMGQVFLGFHMRLECDVAVKVLDPGLELRADSQERLLREGLVLASIRHENIVQVHHCDRTDDGKVFVVMELLKGETLRQLGRRVGTLDALDLVKIGLQICRALERAHAAGVIHRDITPSNVMVLEDPEGLVKVIDFGISRVLDAFHARHPQRFAKPPGSRLATPAGVQLGNPEYMAPELLVREPFVPPNGRTDVFSVAVVLFELLTGVHPFRQGDRKQARSVRQVMPDFEYIELEQALGCALRSDPEVRTPTMAALRDGLELAHDCILAQRGEACDESSDGSRRGARLVRLDSFRPAEETDDEEPQEAFLAVVRTPPAEEDVGPVPATPVVLLRPVAPSVAPTPEAIPEVTPGDGPPDTVDSKPASQAPRAVVGALVIAPSELAVAPPRGAQGWFAAHMSGVILGTGIVAGVGATLASQRLGDSIFIRPERLAEVEAAADLCEQALEDARASLAEAEAELSATREQIAVAASTRAHESAATSVTAASPAPLTPLPIAQTPSPSLGKPSVSRHQAIRRSLDKVLAEVRECNAEAGGGRLARLRARIRVEANGQASAVELVGGSSIAVCVTAAIRGRRYATGDEAEWVQHDFMFVSKEEMP